MEIPGNELHKRGFSRSGESHEGGFLASGDGEGEVGEDGIIRIGVGEIFEFYISLPEFKDISCVVSLNLRNIVEQIPEFFYGYEIFGDIFKKIYKINQGRFEKCNNRHKPHKISNGERMAEHSITDDYIYNYPQERDKSSRCIEHQEKMSIHFEVMIFSFVGIPVQNPYFISSL